MNEAALVEQYAGLARAAARQQSSGVRGLKAQAADREDFEQIAMLELVRAVRSYDAGRGVPLSAHICKRVRWRVKDEIRELTGGRSKNRRSIILSYGLPSDLAAGDVPTYKPAEPVDAPKLLKRLSRALPILNRDERSWLRLVVFGEMRFKEAAAVSGLKVNRLQHVRQTAIAKLRAALQES